jgi:hypothetical protein
MKIVPILLILFFLALPAYGFADCAKTGTTVIYINGIFGDEKSALADKELLKRRFVKISDRKDVDFINGFNASHGGGAVDVVQVALQMLLGESVDHDLTDILNQAHENLKTQKVLLLGYSQGSFYSNAGYQYLTGKGEMDKNSVGVYNVGSTASWVAGNGKYATSDTDKVIKAVREKAQAIKAKEPLPANITFELPEDQKNDDAGGHYFSKSYLALAADRIIGDINSEIGQLTANADKEECFVKPKKGIFYWISDTGLYALDNAGKHPESLTTGLLPQNKMAEVANAVGNFMSNFGKWVVSGTSKVLANVRSWSAGLTASPAVSNPPVVVNVASDQIITPANNPPVVPKPQPKQITLQDQLDNIQEKLDTIQEQINILVPKPIEAPVILAIAKTETPEEIQQQPQPQIVLPEVVLSSVYSSSGGSSAKIVYPNILISEVQLESTADAKDEFVELYNPNNSDVDLSGWYLHRKTAGSQSWSTYASSRLFSEKTILAKGYFLIARTDFYANLGDIFTDSSITNDNSFALKNPNGEISDKLGFGDASDPELLATQNPDVGQSIGRKVLSDGSEEETNNNLSDFELQNPTPKSGNITYVPPINQLSITTYIIDNLTIDLEFSETVNADVDILNSLGVKVRDLYSSSSVKNPDPKIWDEKDNSGVVVANGIYTISVVITNPAGDLVTDISKTITINKILSNDASVTSENYAVGALVDGAGTVSGVGYKTAKTYFESAITLATGASADFSAVENPVANGNTFVVTAEDGVATATYTISVDTTNWSQGTIDSINGSNIVLRTRDFVPNQWHFCSFEAKTYKNVFPAKDNQISMTNGSCEAFFPTLSNDMSRFTDIGEYDFYGYYCGTLPCPGAFPIGKYYRAYFDGAVWTALAPDNTKLQPSSDVELKVTNSYVLSWPEATYDAKGVLINVAGTIDGVRRKHFKNRI